MSSVEEPMTIDEIRKYLHKMRFRYWQAKDKKERSRLLDEMVEVTNLHRKSIIRLINGELARKHRKRERGRIYGIEVEYIVRVIAESLDFPCAERLQPNLVWMAKHLANHKQIELSAHLLEKLDQVSVSTVRRLLASSQNQINRLAHRKPPRSPGNSLTKGIPMRRIAWDEPEPGHFEVDLVHHCGESSAGQYVHTIQMVDVTTGWSECMAVLGRSYLVIEDGFKGILSRLPFSILELHPDNGSEFFNYHLLHFFGKTLPKLDLSRSRPYEKNDNPFVEENNFSLVRAYIGYIRLDTINQTLLLNLLYEKLWLYHNFFQPVMRLKEKVISSSNPKRIKRIYDKAQTPFDRLVSKNVLDIETTKRLAALRELTNPIQLRDEISRLLDQLYSLPCAKEGQVDDVHQLLGWWKNGRETMIALSKVG